MSEQAGFTRRRFFSVAAATIATGPLGLVALSRRVDAMTEAQTAVAQPAAGGKAGVRPFQVKFLDGDLADLRKRINATRWPEPETVTDASQGVQFATIQKLARYWGSEYDPGKLEPRITTAPHFITVIDGLDIHFIHVRSKHENALPVIVTHGWPGSFIEQMELIEPLTNPTAHGSSAADAFHVVIPSLPGYGFSGKPTTNDWDPPHIASAWTQLMKRLGYTKFVAQGGDWGNAVSEVMALQAPPELLGIATNMAATVPVEISKAMASGSPPPSTLSADERRAWDQLDFFYKKGLAYANEMGLRPQTLYAIADSPVGLAAWILDHDKGSYELIVRVFDGKPEGLTRDDICDNISMYWLTNTAISSARLYWTTRARSKGGGFFDTRGVKLPVIVSAFPDEIYTAPKSWSERAYPKLLLYSKHPRGAHYAAWEQPAAIVSDLRTGFKSLR